VHACVCVCKSEGEKERARDRQREGEREKETAVQQAVILLSRVPNIYHICPTYDSHIQMVGGLKWFHSKAAIVAQQRINIMTLPSHIKHHHRVFMRIMTYQ